MVMLPLPQLSKKYGTAFFQASMIAAGLGRKLWPEFGDTQLGAAMCQHLDPDALSFFDMTNAAEA
jgi:hypothetical protein